MFELVQSMTPVFARYLEILTMGRDVCSEDFDRRETGSLDCND